MNPLEEIIDIATRNLAEARERLTWFASDVDGCTVLTDGDYLVEHKPEGREGKGTYVVLEELGDGRRGIGINNKQTVLRGLPWQASLMSKRNAITISKASKTFRVVKMKDALIQEIKEQEEFLEMIASKSSSHHQDGPYKGCLRRDANYTVTVNNA